MQKVQAFMPLPSIRARLFLVLAGIALFSVLAVALFMRGVARRAPGISIPGAVDLPGPPGARRLDASASPSPGTPSRSSLFEGLLRGRMGFERIEYLGGTRARVERLQIPVGRDPSQVIQVGSAELELDVKALSLSGALNGAAVVRNLLKRRLPMLELPDGFDLPMKIGIPTGQFGSFMSWSFTSDLSGQKLWLRPWAALAPVPLVLKKGRLEFNRGSIRLGEVDLALGKSRLSIDARITDALTSPAFGRSTIDGFLDLPELLISGASGKPLGSGQLAMKVEVEGPAERPRISGSLRGALDVPHVPLSLDIAGLLHRSIEMRFAKVSGQVQGGGETGPLVSADLSTGEGRMEFLTPHRTIAFRAGRSDARMTASGTWTAPEISQTVELLDGVVEYRHINASEHADPVTGLDFPYARLQLETTASRTTTTYVFTATSPHAERVRATLAVDGSRKPAMTSYVLDSREIDLAWLTHALLGPQLALKGKLSLQAQGTSTSMAFEAMRGHGAGVIRGLMIDWKPDESSLMNMDIADLLRRAAFPTVSVDAPQFGNLALLKFRGEVPGVLMTGYLEVTPNLRFQGRFDYQLERSFLNLAPAADAALMYRGANGKVSMRVSGEPGKPRVELQFP